MVDLVGAVAVGVTTRYTARPVHAMSRVIMSVCAIGDFGMEGDGYSL